MLTSYGLYVILSVLSWVVEIDDEFGPEFDDLPEDVRTEILVLTRLLQQFGPQLGRPRVDTLNGSRHAKMKDKRKTMEAVAGYFHRNRARMQYHEYLANGWPIASGPVEGACKNLIKDRMERSGMRWTEPMAEAIVKLRAIYLSGDFDCYWEFHIEQDQQRLYPADWTVVPK